MTQPFSHDDLAIKQQLYKLARDFHMNMGDSLEKELAAALLYMNVADYIAEYLVVGLHDMATEAVSKYYLGLVSMHPPQRDKLNIGNSVHQLERYEFPRKTEILDELKAINSARKKIAHQMLKTKGQDLNQIDEAVMLLAQHTETLVALVDDLSMGMPPPNLYEKLFELDPTQFPETTDQAAAKRGKTKGKKYE